MLIFFLFYFFLGKPSWILWTDINQVIKFKSLSFVTYRMNAFWEWFYGTPAGYFSIEKSTNMYIVHTKFIPQNCQCAQVYPVHRCRKIFRIQYRTWNLVNKINALHGHWSTHTLNFMCLGPIWLKNIFPQHHKTTYYIVLYSYPLWLD